MKKHALILSTGLALLTASRADAQESGRLSADYLKEATPLNNEGWIDAPSGIVWANLIDAAQWPN